MDFFKVTSIASKVASKHPLDMTFVLYKNPIFLVHRHCIWRIDQETWNFSISLKSVLKKAIGLFKYMFFISKFILHKTNSTQRTDGLMYCIWEQKKT